MDRDTSNAVCCSDPGIFRCCWGAHPHRDGHTTFGISDFWGSRPFPVCTNHDFGDSKPEQEIELATSGSETAIFPLAVPSIAGPGTILAAVLQTENARFNLLQQIQTTAIILSVLLIVLLLMLAASWIHRLIGNSGASIISRIMGLIFGSVAVSNVLAGITEYFSL